MKCPQNRSCSIAIIGAQSVMLYGSPFFILCGTSPPIGSTLAISEKKLVIYGSILFSLPTQKLVSKKKSGYNGQFLYIYSVHVLKQHNLYWILFIILHLFGRPVSLDKIANQGAYTYCDQNYCNRKIYCQCTGMGTGVI